MSLGGVREGAGRKTGDKNKRTLAAEQMRADILESGRAPLEVMIDGMRKAEAEGRKLQDKLASYTLPEIKDGAQLAEALKALTELHRAQQGWLRTAHECAKDAAPYLHPKLANVDRSIEFPMPKIETTADLLPAQSAVIEAVSAGQVTLDEAVKLSNILEMRRRTVETVEIEKRLAELETKQGNGK